MLVKGQDIENPFSYSRSERIEGQALIPQPLIPRSYVGYKQLIEHPANKPSCLQMTPLIHQNLNQGAEMDGSRIAKIQEHYSTQIQHSSDPLSF